ncbi:MAG: saccharopine dehydrogenase [Saprospiraceae bacterium]|nr:MAG: saccharopine dehydrogenase [Saprospiraceae bacterium]
MQQNHNIVIAGAGGIAEAAALIIAEWSTTPTNVFIGDCILSKAVEVARWVKDGTTRQCHITPFHLPENTLTLGMKDIFSKGGILLDCLPGKNAPLMANYAKDFHLHYVNLTEYVAETNQIMAFAKDAETGFVLQSGLAPGYIDVLANGMFRSFCEEFGVDKVDTISMKVGALTKNAVAPHYYGFTWSPVGVATEYLKDAVCVRNFKKTLRPALSETHRIIIHGITYEDDLTSGGAADLPDALAGKVRNLDYKTLRYPGHYDWVKDQLAAIPAGDDQIAILQERMEAAIPRLEEDKVVVYVAVEGSDSDGALRRQEKAKVMEPQKVGKHMLRAIQTTTASPLVQAAAMLLEGTRKGVILQSQIDPMSFLGGDFIVKVYGEP